MDHKSKYLTQQFLMYVKSGIPLDLILYEKNDQFIIFEVGFYNKKDVDLKPIAKIYFDGIRRFIWTNLHNFVVDVTFEKINNETDEDIFLTYINKIIPYSGFKYYSENDLKRGFFFDEFVSFVKNESGVYDFIMNEDKMQQENLPVYYIFHSDLIKIIWVKREACIEKIIMSKLI